MKTFWHALTAILEANARRRLWIAFGLAGLLACIEAVGLALVLPLIMLVQSNRDGGLPGEARWLADVFGTSDVSSTLQAVAILTVGLFLLRGVSSVLFLRWTYNFLMESEAVTATRLLRVYVTAPYEAHLQRSSADLERNIHIVLRRVYREAIVGITAASADVFVVVAATTVLIVLAPLAAITGISFFAIASFGYQRVVHSRVQAAGDEVLDLEAKSFSIVAESLGSIKNLLLSHRQEYFVSRLATNESRMTSRVSRLLLLTNLPRYYLEVTLVIGVAATSAVLFAFDASDGAIAALGLFLAAGFRVLPSVNRLLVAASRVRANLTAATEIAEDLRSGPSCALPRASDRLRRSPTIAFHSVCYQYGSGAPVLHDVDLELKPNSFVAIVGPSGAGKTTLVDIALGLLDPTSGEVRIDERPLPELRAEWQRSIAYVPQEVALLTGSLRSNIAFGYPVDAIDDERVWRALRAVHLTDFVEGLPEGLDTAAGEAGRRLSGGQRQRIALARALYDEPLVLVLDEATSALDVDTEHQVSRALSELRRSMTVIVVAHRLSTVREADIIYFVDQGSINGSGTFDQLAEAHTGFRRFVELAELRVRAPVSEVLP